MFTNYLKVTLRNLYREKMYALINLAGLSIAIACCLILGLWLRSELTYDRHNVNYKQIYRMISSGPFGTAAFVSSELGPLLARDYSEVLESVRFGDCGIETSIKHGENSFRWDGVKYADDNVFKVFSHDIIYGDAETALVSPTSVAVSETFSKKYFGAANPVGETILINEKPYEITLVFGDLPENSNLRYDVLLSYNIKERAAAQENTGVLMVEGCPTYLLMPEGYSAQDFKPISDTIYEKYMAKKGFPDHEKYFLQPLSDIHLNSDIPGENTGNKFYVYGFSVVAVFILLVACINYMNLATARAAKRAKEIGIRKILGVGKTALMLQFLGEAIFFSVIALFFGLVLLEIVVHLTPINSLLAKPLALNFLEDPELLLWILGFCLVVGLVSGAYPAFYLSAMPVSSMVTGHRAGKGSTRFRQVLVVIQFTITVTVVACTLLMALQMQYVSRKPLGFEKENRLTITLLGSDVAGRISTIKTELLKNSHILEITHSDAMLPVINQKLGIDIIGDELTMSIMNVDSNFFSVMAMEMVSGRDFSKKLLTDIGSSIIVNEAMVKMQGWDEPLGQRLKGSPYKVIGVVKDFHFASLHSPVEPLGITRFGDSTGFSQESFMRQLVIHISEEDIPGTLSFLEEKLAEFYPNQTFRYEFLDDALDSFYLSENRLMKLIGSFGGVCIFISCLGLLGLSAFTTEQRTKEIGIRKVLGASTWRIIRMLFRNILLLVLCGALFASFVAYLLMDEWLSSFAYRTGINPMVFLVSALLAAVVAFVTVALQSYKTARANPVNALRYE